MRESFRFQCCGEFSILPSSSSGAQDQSKLEYKSEQKYFSICKHAILLCYAATVFQNFHL